MLLSVEGSETTSLGLSVVSSRARRPAWAKGPPNRLLLDRRAGPSNAEAWSVPRESLSGSRPARFPPFHEKSQRKANDQFNQWLAVDPSDGSVSLSWYDTRNDSSHQSTDVFYARSTDGGLSFSANLKVTTAPTNETCCGADLGNQYGDYEGIAALNGKVHPVWTDRRASVESLDEEVFSATIAIG